MASAESTTPPGANNGISSTVQNTRNVENVAAQAKNDLKKLLIENRLNVDDEVRITDQSDAKFFKLIIKTKRFSAKDFTIEIVGTKLIVKAAYEKMKADNVTKMREKFVYEHELPKDAEDASITKNFVAEGLLEIVIKRKLNV